MEVPANAEIVLEGYVDPEDIRDEGPFGDHTGYYTPVEPYPTFTLTGIMRRKNPVYVTTVVGKPILEDAYIGKVIERSFLPIDQNVPSRSCRFQKCQQQDGSKVCNNFYQKKISRTSKKSHDGFMGNGTTIINKNVCSCR